MATKGRVLRESFLSTAASYGSQYYAAQAEFVTSAQAVSSFGNRYRELGRRKGDIGSPFISQKMEIQMGSPKKFGTSYWGGPIREIYTLVVPSQDVVNSSAQAIHMSGSTDSIQEFADSSIPLGFSSSELTALGARAVNSMAPTNPASDFSTTLAEFLSEKKFFSMPGKAGSAPGEYLNYQFGIAPTIGYAQDLRNAIRDKEKILAQLSRDSGKLVRRSGQVFQDGDESSRTESGVYPAFVGAGLTSDLVYPGTLRVSSTVSRRAWFSGAFTYYLPPAGSLMRTVAELDAVYGVKVNVDTAWELLPFSWLVDYKTSAGAAISNLSKFSSDGLVLPYGYIMGETKSTDVYTWSGPMNDGNNNIVNQTVVAHVVRTTKQRQPASPFGFGILPGDLSKRQLSILAALGLTYLK